VIFSLSKSKQLLSLKPSPQREELYSSLAVVLEDPLTVITFQQVMSPVP
jgi:hypothetical protein